MQSLLTCTSQNKQSLQAERKYMSVIQSKYAVVQCTKMCRPFKHFLIPATTCFIAEVDEYLEKAYILKKKKSLRKTFQLILLTLNHLFWLLRVMRMTEGCSRLPWLGSTMTEWNTDMPGIQRFPATTLHTISLWDFRIPIWYSSLAVPSAFYPWYLSHLDSQFFSHFYRKVERGNDSKLGGIWGEKKRENLKTPLLSLVSNQHQKNRE